MIKRIENLIILCLGFCLGAFVGILSAPTKGSIARDEVMYRLKSSKKKLHAFILKLIGHKNDLTNEAKNSGKEVITDVVSSAQQILKELELIAAQLEEKMQ
ncbi:MULTISPECIES: YtxH domain-containing protein [unclassified Candidatus Cardinium]|uniref:YtxH domain-containing protein n=1 Tax=unclassified Candidatus Cardinium TaxID=2641185 RepID=UPI001FB3491D|nr:MULTISPECIES: YtxH domain-containing protein [unclassified Candidatus Cardinium]